MSLSPEAPLGQRLLNAQQWTFASLLNLMGSRGHKNLTTAHLMFLANLDCGSTHASLVARRMGVSRQAVYRSTRELQAQGALTLADDPIRRNQKVIQMTQLGAVIALDARACMAEVEATIKQRIGEQDFEKLYSILKRDWGDIVPASIERVDSQSVP